MINNPSEFTAVVWKDNSYNLKKMTWNDNLQNNCLEQQFAKKMSGTTIPKSMAKELPRTTIYKQKKYSAERHLQKKKLARMKVCRKRCPEHQFEKSCTERLFAKNKLSRTTVCRICKKNDLSQLFAKAV